MSANEGSAIRVWDPFIRIFHWSLVATFTVAYLTGEDAGTLHTSAGYIVLGLLAARLVWGFVGPRRARFRDFTYSPRETLAYARGLLAGRPKQYVGHNPLGALMIFALLASLLVTGLTGFALEQGLTGEAAGAWLSPPALVNAAHAHDEEAHEGAEGVLAEIHEAAANLTVLLVLLHIAGVLLGSVLHRENLIRAMISGNKSL